MRSQPREERQWAVSASASWIVAIDNVSFIPDWWSDALCKAVTGDGWIDRTLYTNSDVTVLSFRRVILLTSIDAGALRGNLGDRALLVDLEPIEDVDRLTEQELDAHYAAARPQLFGALLDLLAKVLEALPQVKLECAPRMADFACLLAAMDKVTGGNSLSAYLGQRERIAETIIESDAVAVAVQKLADDRQTWEGTAAELLELIKPTEWHLRGYPPKGWPKNPNTLGGRLRRVAPALKQIGVEIALASPQLIVE